jgi:hypothetical protein
MILETPAPGGGARRPRRLFALPVHAGFLIAFVSAMASGQPLTFQTLLVDTNGSGDDKTVADIDVDGDDDGILGGIPTGVGSDDELAWYESTGPGRSFVRHDLLISIEEFTTDIETADIDGDGDPDIVYADGTGTNRVRWLENPKLDPPPGVPADPTNGANWTIHLVGTHGNYSHDIEVGLVDADLLLDIVTLGNGFFKVHFQNSPTSWTTVDFGQHAGDGSPAIADIDGDGDRDVFVQGGWIRNPPSSKRDPANWDFFPITNSDPGDGPAAAAVDIDRDGRIDLVTCRQHDDNGALAWYKNPANPTQAGWARTVIAANAGSHHLRVADFDGDARPDLLVGLELSQGYVRVYRNTGSTPAFTMHPVVSGGGGHNAAVGDLDGNGLPDVWAADWIGNPPLRAYFNGPNVIFRDGFETGNTSKWSPGS